MLVTTCSGMQCNDSYDVLRRDWIPTSTVRISDMFSSSRISGSSMIFDSLEVELREFLSARGGGLGVSSKIHGRGYRAKATTRFITKSVITKPNIISVQQTEAAIPFSNTPFYFLRKLKGESSSVPN